MTALGRRIASWSASTIPAALILLCTHCSSEPPSPENHRPLIASRSSALTGTHQVVFAYFPIFPRWEFVPPNCPGKLWIGDPQRQFPLLQNNGLPYGNSRDTDQDRDVLRFDFQAAANAGATVLNPHLFGTTPDWPLLERIDAAAALAGVAWTPTFESLQNDASGMATATQQTIDHFGANSQLLRIQNDPVFFWYFTPSVAASDIGVAIGAVRASHGYVRILLDTAGNMPNQNGSGKESVNQWFSDQDGFTNHRRASGFYVWVSVFWALKSPLERKQTIANYLKTVGTDYQPVLCTSPSYNEENWGYQNGVPPTDNCGIGGDRSNQPHYNVDRSLAEWQANLKDLLSVDRDDTWIYLQAYDEWAEGSTVAPNTASCFDFLATFRSLLQSKGWLQETGPYCRPDYPLGYSPSECSSVPVCSAVPEAGVQDTGGADTTTAEAGIPESSVSDGSAPETNADTAIAADSALGKDAASEGAPALDAPKDSATKPSTFDARPEEDSGCQCTAVAASNPTGAAWLVLSATALWCGRRRRRTGN